VPEGRYRSGPAARTTNQRMEVRAVLEAVTTLDGRLQIVSDSTYVVNCFRDGWWRGWLARGWLNSQKKPVANRDLWEPLIDEYRKEPERLAFRWVKGHGGDPYNDLVDRLAVEAALTQNGRDGEGTPKTPAPDVEVARHEFT
jgi:ribonuclease HI